MKHCTKNIAPKKILLTSFFTLLVLLILLGGAYFYTKNFSQKTTPPNTLDLIQTVTISPLVNTTLPLTIQTFGQIVSNTSVSINSESSGIITAINFKPGQKVKKGDALFTLKSNDTSAQLDQLAAALSIAKQRYERNQALLKLSQEAISQIDFLQSKSDYEQALAQYQEAQAIHTIISPIDGIISDTDLSIGDFVNTGDLLAQVISPENLQIKYQLPSEHLNQIKLGQKIIFYPEGFNQNSDQNNIFYSGSVSYISPSLSAGDYEITLRADLNNSQNPQNSPPLLNTFGQIVQTLDPAHQVIAIPQTLAQTDSQGFYVFIAVPNKTKNKIYTVSQHYFIPGQITKTGLIEARSGLTLGMDLITSNPSSLTPGETIQINSAPSSTRANTRFAPTPTSTPTS